MHRTDMRRESFMDKIEAIDAIMYIHHSIAIWNLERGVVDWLDWVGMHNLPWFMHW